MGYKYKFFFIGLIITFLMILIPSYSSPFQNYTGHKNQYEGYNLIIKNCGESPSKECLTKLCDYYYTYPEAFGDFCRCDKFTGDATKNSCIWSVKNNTLWKQYTRADKPNFFILFIPKIVNGLEFYGMYGYLGLIVLLFPILGGLFLEIFLIILRKYYDEMFK